MAWKKLSRDKTGSRVKGPCVSLNFTGELVFNSPAIEKFRITVDAMDIFVDEDTHRIGLKQCKNGELSVYGNNSFRKTSRVTKLMRGLNVAIPEKGNGTIHASLSMEGGMLVFSYEGWIQ